MGIWDNTRSWLKKKGPIAFAAGGTVYPFLQAVGIGKEGARGLGITSAEDRALADRVWAAEQMSGMTGQGMDARWEMAKRQSEALQPSRDLLAQAFPTRYRSRSDAVFADNPYEGLRPVDLSGAATYQHASAKKKGK